MTREGLQKVADNHITRDAYLYVRQAAIGPAYENSKDLELQYALRQGAMALGWPNDRIIIIDCDCGVSAARNAGREGFESLVGAVGEGRAGIVMALDGSRFARRDCDWWRLVEVCALTDTLLLDAVAVYDPRDPADRLLLGLKATMPQFEASGVRSRRGRGVVRFMEL